MNKKSYLCLLGGMTLIFGACGAVPEAELPAPVPGPRTLRLAAEYEARVSRDLEAETPL